MIINNVSPLEQLAYGFVGNIGLAAHVDVERSSGVAVMLPVSNPLDDSTAVSTKVFLFLSEFNAVKLLRTSMQQSFRCLHF